VRCFNLVVLAKRTEVAGDDENSLKEQARHRATQCNTVQHSAAQCNILQHTTT